MENVFRVEYDDDPFMIVNKINKKLEHHGLTIENIEGNKDGYEEFKIVTKKKTKDINQLKLDL